MSESKVVRFTVSLAVRENKFAEFESIAREMIAVSRKEPGTLEYDWYLGADQSTCRLLEAYEDSTAVRAHMKGRAVLELVPKLIQVAQLAGFEVYGTLDAEAAGILANYGAHVFRPWHALPN